MKVKQLVTVTLVAAMIVAGSAPAAVAATTDASESLTIEADQSADTGDVTVTVTENGTAVENATVAVNASGTGNYSGEGTYATDAEGTVSLDEPSEAVTVSLTATKGTLSAETSVELAPTTIDVGVEQTNETVTVVVTRSGEPVENASVRVETDGDYAGTGTYETDGDGTVALPTPTANVVVTVTATAGGDSATTTVTLERPGDPQANDFAWQLQSFVQLLREQGVSGFGQEVSEFVHEHNPASADDHAGNRGGADDGERGPPEHAGADGQRSNGHDETADEERDDGTQRGNDGDRGGNGEARGHGK